MKRFLIGIFWLLCITVYAQAQNGSPVFTITVMHSAYNPTDGASEYFAVHPAVPVTNNRTRVYVRDSYTITEVEFNNNVPTTTGTNEAWSLYIRVNDTTDYLVGTVSSTTQPRVWSNDTLNIQLVDGDYFQLKYVNPTWATNPGAVSGGGYVVLVSTSLIN